MSKNATAEEITLMKKQLGYDLPMQVRFYKYINDLSPISYYDINEDTKDEYKYSVIMKTSDSAGIVHKKPYFGRSITYSNERVSKIVYNSMIPTFWLSLFAIIFAAIVGIPMGVYASLNQGKFTDSFMIVTSVIGISMPSYVLGSIFLLITGASTGNLIELQTNGEYYVNMEKLILPGLALGLMPLSVIVQLMRSNMLDVLKQDYIRTAKAKGLSFTKVIVKHAIKNALNPVITALTGWFAALMAGAIFVEIIFEYKGIGFHLMPGILKKDFPLVMGYVIFISAIFIIINILVDVIYAILDPRVRLK